MLAELGDMHCQFIFGNKPCIFIWVLQLPNSRLVKLALVHEAELKDNLVLDHQQKGWTSSVFTFLAIQPRHPCVF